LFYVGASAPNYGGKPVQKILLTKPQTNQSHKLSDRQNAYSENDVRFYCQTLYGATIPQNF